MKYDDNFLWGERVKNKSMEFYPIKIENNNQRGTQRKEREKKYIVHNAMQCAHTNTEKKKQKTHTKQKDRAR